MTGPPPWHGSGRWPALLLVGLLVVASGAAAQGKAELLQRWHELRAHRLTSNDALLYEAPALDGPSPVKPARGPPLCDWARGHLIDESFLLLTFVTGAYSTVALNWAAALARFDVKGAAIALDEEAVGRLARADIPAYSAPLGTTGDFGALWIARMKVLEQLIECGVRVAMADSDAIFVRRPTWPTTREVDVWVSQGTWPSDVFEAWGTTACMGLAFFSPSPRTLSLVRAVAADVERSLDDQVSLNRLLRSRGIAALSAASGDDHMAALMGRADDGLRVAFISTAVVLRDCDAHRRADVPPLAMHCLTKKTAQSKERDMRQRGLWLLDD